MPTNLVVWFIRICFFVVAKAGLKAGLSSSEVEELLSLAKSQPIKDKLKQTTEEAINYKASVRSFPLIDRVSQVFGSILSLLLFRHSGFLSSSAMLTEIPNCSLDRTGSSSWLTASVSKICIYIPVYSFIIYLIGCVAFCLSGEKWLGPQPDRPTSHL